MANDDDTTPKETPRSGMRVRLADGLFWRYALQDFESWGEVYVDATGLPVPPQIAYPNLFQMLGFAASRGIMASA